MSTCARDITLEENLTIFLVITWICSRNLEHSYLEKGILSTYLLGLVLDSTGSLLYCLGNCCKIWNDHLSANAENPFWKEYLQVDTVATIF